MHWVYGWRLNQSRRLPEKRIVDPPEYALVARLRGLTFAHGPALTGVRHWRICFPDDLQRDECIYPAD